jgi:UPF0271 protein
MRVDLNADVGEALGPGLAGIDAGLMQSITSASVAAGFHGGDPSVLRETIRMAGAAGVALGAHPGFPDREGFGRRELRVSAREAEDFVLYQVAAVAGVAAAEGVRLQHVKPHGALYTMAAHDPILATAIVRAAAAIDPALAIFGPPRSQLLNAARAAGMRAVAEVFADRAYRADGSLVPRGETGAILREPSAVVGRAVRMVQDRTVEAVDGTTLPLDVDTICLHGDTPGADDLAARLRAALESAGIAVRAIGEP